MKNKKTEIRNLQATLISTDSESRLIEGVIPYNTPSEYMGFFEFLDKGCFTKTLLESKDIRALYDHQDGALLARTKNGSLTFDDREDGLHFFFEAPNTTVGNDALELVRSGLASGTSFGMIVVKDDWANTQERHIKEARLLEVSVLASLPAYPDSKVYARSLSEAMKEKEQLNEEDLASVKEEIDRLQEIMSKANAVPVGEETTESAPNVQEETTQPDNDAQQLEELLARLEAVGERLDRSLRNDY